MTETKLCMSCGAPLSPTANFCRECGSAAPKPASVAESASTVPVEKGTTEIATVEKAAVEIAPVEKAVVVTTAEPLTANELVNDGVALYENGDYNGALSKFEKATEADPALAAAWSDKGCALGRLGKRDAALGAFKKALEIAPDNREASEGRALCIQILSSS
ncbi:MAG: tetratricopeptide repeat protein [Halobacteriota archaeon]